MKSSKIIALCFILVLSSCSTTKKVRTTSAKKYNKIKTEKSVVETKEEVKTSNAILPVETEKKEELEATSKITTGTTTVIDYIDTFKSVAKSNMSQYGIPASIILAQGILESGAGKGRLCLEANNHFGIKCHTGWTGPSITHDDDAAQECFRKYNDPADSYRDHALFLTSRSRYNSLFELDKLDYKGWANGLKNAGYATDPKYPSKLIGIIERYQLYKYDHEAIGKQIQEEPKVKTESVKVEESKPVVKKKETLADVIASINKSNTQIEEKISETSTKVNEIEGDLETKNSVSSTPIDLKENEYLVQKGDTLYSLSKRFNTTVENLKQINNLSDFSISIGQIIKIK